MGAELEAKKTPASSGGAINTAGTDCCKEDRRSPCQTSYQRVYFGERKRGEGCHQWL